MLHRLIFAALLSCVSGPARALPPLKQAPELPAELIKQFEALGFQYGHFVPHKDEGVHFEPRSKSSGKGIPGFAEGEAGIDDTALSKLPRTDAAFALDLRATDVTDAG